MANWIAKLKQLPEWQWASLGMIRVEELAEAAALKISVAAPFPIDNQMLADLLFGEAK